MVSQQRMTEVVGAVHDPHLPFGLAEMGMLAEAGAVAFTISPFPSIPVGRPGFPGVLS